MVTETRNNFSTLSQTQLEVLGGLVRRLRGHARAIKNAAAARNMRLDMVTAAQVIEQHVLCRHAADMVAALPPDEAKALARMANRFFYEDAVRFANRHDGGAERDALLGGIGKLRSALAGAGFAPR